MGSFSLKPLLCIGSSELLSVAESGFDSGGGGGIYIHYACILKHTHITYMLGSCKGIFIFLLFFLVKIPLINENIFSN